MAGTYNDKELSQQDKARVESLSQQWFEQKAADADQGVLDAIHDQAEAVRAQYNYSGGADGSDYLYLRTDTPSKSAIASATPQSGYIDQLYQAQIDQAFAELKAAFDDNVAGVDASAAKIPAIYQIARNQTAATSEINQAAFNEKALANGINSGAGSQASLAMGNQHLGNMSTINSQESEALKDIETERLRLKTNYNNAIAQAKAEGNLAKAQALYSEAVRVDEGLVAQSQAQAAQDYQYWSTMNAYNQQEYAIQLQKAQEMAAYGNFSGYLGLGYTQEEVNQMRKAWVVQNPLLARKLGIS